MSVLEMITMVDFPETQYVREETPKTMIHLHHTASSGNPYGVIEYWASTPERVATHFVIAGPPPPGITSWYDGQIFQIYNTRFWGYHLGIGAKHMPRGSKSSTHLNSQAIGIEICNWGPLTRRADGKYLSWTKSFVPEDRVIALDYRGFKYFQTYTDSQIRSTKLLMEFLAKARNIPVEFKGMEMFDYTPRAFFGEPGIWTHTSYRRDKSDCHPQPELVKMLQTLRG
jgi:N-acetyl-anhydromuramyl-L-alanine amidase AmpD